MADWRNSQFFPAVRLNNFVIFLCDSLTNFVIFSGSHLTNFVIFFPTTDCWVSRYFPVINCRLSWDFSCVRSKEFTIFFASDWLMNFAIYSCGYLVNCTVLLTTDLRNSGFFPHIQLKNLRIFPMTDGRWILRCFPMTIIGKLKKIRVFWLSEPQIL